MSAISLENLLRSGNSDSLDELVKKAQNMGELTHILQSVLETDLDSRLWDWMDRVYRGWTPPNPNRDADVLEDLRSLGYL
jgi:hypothetical protein